MNFLAIVLYFLHVIISIFLILVVLLQQGKGADLAVFGGGGTQAAFGARGAANIFHRLTVIGFILFIVTTLSIGILQARRSGTTVMTGVAAESQADEAATTSDEATATETQTAPVGEEPGTEPEGSGEGAASEPAGAVDSATGTETSSQDDSDGAASAEPEGENQQ